MANHVLIGKLQPVNITLGYFEWRDTVAARDEDLLDALEKLTVPELYAANDRLMGGLAAERLNPTNSHGDFHFAAGMIRGLLYKAGHKFNTGGLDHKDLG